MSNEQEHPKGLDSWEIENQVDDSMLVEAYASIRTVTLIFPMLERDFEYDLNMSDVDTLIDSLKEAKEMIKAYHAFMESRKRIENGWL